MIEIGSALKLGQYWSDKVSEAHVGGYRIAGQTEDGLPADQPERVGRARLGGEGADCTLDGLFLELHGAMVAEHVGSGSQYLALAKDADGNYFDGSRLYRLRLDADVPAENFWS